MKINKKYISFQHVQTQTGHIDIFIKQTIINLKK